MEQTTAEITRLLYKEIGKGENNSPQDPDPRFQPMPYKVVQTDNPAAEAQKIEEAPPPAPTFSEADVAVSRQSGYEEGYDKGYKTAKSDEAEMAKKVQASLDDITIKLAAISEAVKTRNNEHINEFVQLTLRVAHKVAGSALRRDPYTEIENVFRGSLPLLFDEPKISIAVAPDLVQDIESRITSLAKSEGLQNNIEISGNPGLSPGSCDIQWHCGGIKSDKDALWSRIENLCDNI